MILRWCPTTGSYSSEPSRKCTDLLYPIHALGAELVPTELSKPLGLAAVPGPAYRPADQFARMPRAEVLPVVSSSSVCSDQQ